MQNEFQINYVFLKALNISPFTFVAMWQKHGQGNIAAFHL